VVLAALVALAAIAGQAGGGLPLIGTTWVAVDLAGLPVPADPAARRPVLEFVAGGRVAGRDGCNRFSGPYRQQGDRLSFGALAVTRMACPDAEEITHRFGAALKGTTRFRIAGGRLELYGATGTPLAIFAARVEAPPEAERPRRRR
jgi:heat shock protein HslJ